MSAENSTKNSTTKQVGRPFKKGQSGNPGGRPKKPKELKEKGKIAEERLWAIAECEDTPLKERINIYEYIHDKAFGKATQKLAGDEDGAPIISIVMSPSVKEYAE